MTSLAGKTVLGESGRPRLSFLSTDAVRWHQERLQVDPQTSVDQLKQTIHGRERKLRSGPTQTAIVQWTILFPVIQYPTQPGQAF